MTLNKKEYYRKWAAANPEKVREASRKWRTNNPEKARESQRKWRANNPEKAREYYKKWNAANPGKNTEAQRIWRSKDPEKYRENNTLRNRIWRAKNPEKPRESSRKWRTANPERQYEASRKWRLENVEEVRIFRRKWKKHKRETDPNWRLTENMRSAMNGALKGQRKAASTMKIIGCTVEELFEHLESCASWEPWMTRENYGRGGWDVDHIIAISKWDRDCTLQFALCWDKSNLQPMEHIANIKKGGR